MRAADNTIAFVKEWIAGTYTKRQYQNYYIVKTPHAQFLLKRTEARELLAIKDTSGHIYILDSDLHVYDYGEPRIVPNDAMSNPFLCLIQEAYDFKYTRISPQSMFRMAHSQQCLSTISKWKTLDRVEIANPSLSAPVYLSLVEVGDLRLYISPELSVEDRVSPKTPLTEWVQHQQEAAYRFPHQWPQYMMTELYSNKINSIEAIKGNYLAMAGDKADKAWVSNEGWVFVPTDFKTVEEITGREFQSARAARPNPYAYGMVGHGVNLHKLYQRFETIEENALAIKEVVTLRDEFDSGTWKLAIRMGRLPEIADSLIAFFEADDAWLREHFEVAKAGALEAKFRSKVSMGLGGALVHVNAEPNPSPMSEHVVYLKAQNFGSANFVKVLPAPVAANRVKGIFDGDN